MNLKAHPFLRLVLFLVCGILLFENFQLPIVFILLGAGLAILFCSIGIILKRKIILNLGIYSFLIALGWFATFAAIPQKSGIPLEKYEAYLIRVNSAIESKPKSYKAIAQIYKVKTDSMWQMVDDRILLYFTKDDSKPKYGDVYLINASPREIEGPKNPFEFDYKTFQRRRGISMHHFLKKGEFVKIGNQSQNSVMKWSYSFNELAGEKLSENLTNKANLAVAEAMLLGTKDDLDNNVREAYAAAGAIHILAVSGLHVGILLLMLNAFFGILNKNRKTKWLYGILIISCLWMYALFTGLSPSVTRATLMFSLFQLGTFMQKDKNSINVLAASAFLLLLIKPFWLFEVGFQLSYLAIFGIVFLYPYLNEVYKPKSWLLMKLWQISIVSVAAQLFTFPLSIYYFHQFPSYFLLTNPIVTVLSMGILFWGLPSLLFSSVPILSDVLNWLLRYTLDILNWSIFSISELPDSKLGGFSISPFEVLCLYLFLFLTIIFLIKKEPKYLYSGVVIFISLSGWNMWQDYQQNTQREITFHFIPRASGFSLINTKSALFITDSANAQNPRAYDFHLKNYYDNRGIKDFNIKMPIAGNGILQFEIGNQKILWIQKYFRGKIEDDFDKVLISNNALYNLSRQFKRYPKEIILDDTNSKYRIFALQKQADSLGINLLSLYETGGLTYTY